MAATNINAFIQEAHEALATAKAAVKDAEDALDALEGKVRGGDPNPANLPAEPGPAHEGQTKDQTKEVKFK